MTDWTTLQTTGQGQIAIVAEITGLQYVFSTHDWSVKDGVGGPPTDSWYTSEGYLGVKPWLRWDGFEWDEDVDFLSGFLKVSGITLSITDVGGGMTALVKDLEARKSTRLGASVAKADASITVFDTAGFSASGDIWFGLEACHYTGTTATAFTGLTRGYYGTLSSAHTYNWAAVPPRAAWVTDGPRRMEGRPVRIYAAVIGPDGTPGACDCIYRGFVASGIDVSPSEWTIPVEHVSEVFNRSVGLGLPSSPVLVPYYYYTGGSAPNPSSVQFIDYDTATPDETPWELTIAAGGYSSAAALCDAYNVALGGLSTGGPQPLVGIPSGEDKYHIRITGSATNYVVLTVRYGDPLWALGFDPGTYASVADGTIADFEAQSDPRLVVIDITARPGVYPEVSVADNSVFTANLYVHIPGGRYVKVQGTSGSNIVQLKASVADRWHPFSEPWVVESDDEENAVLRHVVAMSADSLSSGLQRVVGLKSGQPEPEEWLARGLSSADIDWDELTAAEGGVPECMLNYYDAITDAIEVKALMNPRFGLCAIAPRVTSDGKIGFARLETPTLRNADAIEVDADVWALVESAGIKVRWGAEPLLTQARVKYNYDYRTDEWPKQPLTVNWDDGSAELGRARSVAYDCRGLVVSPTAPGAAGSTGELETAIAAYLTATIFGAFGRLAPEVDIPCTWLAQQLYCGDVVKVTHPMVPDVSKGAIGMTDRLGLIVGRHVDISGGQHALRVRVPTDSNVGCIAPAALLETYSLTTAIGSCGDVSRYARTGDTDLTHFAACVAADGSCPVRMVQYNTTAPSSWAGTLTNVATYTVGFASDPMSSAFPAAGVWLLFGDWDNASTYEQTGWGYEADTSYGLGSTPDDGYQWGV